MCIIISRITDLAEVVSVTPAAPMPGPPKKTDDKSFFDVSLHIILIKKYTHFKYKFFIENQLFKINNLNRIKFKTQNFALK